MKVSLFWRFIGLVWLILLLTILSACEKRADAVTQMEVSFQWNPKGTALDENPEIRISGIPQATRSFSVKLVG